MTDTLLPRQSLVQEVQNIGAALHALGLKLLKRNSNPCRTPSAAEEANQLRDMAHDFACADPRFAQDLYAAANRHELAASTR